jgi:hypothetical protein
MRHFYFDLATNTLPPVKQPVLTKLCTHLTMVISGKQPSMYKFIHIMKTFSQKVKLTMKFVHYHDESTDSEKMVELLGYYDVVEVSLDHCIFKLRASAMFVLQPPLVLKIFNSSVTFPKYD